MSEVLSRVRRTIADHNLAHGDTRLVAAVSGGSDSMALVHILYELHRRGCLQLVGIVHFNHQLRAASAADERFVRDAAAALNLPIFVESDDVAARAARERRSLEEAARTVRYQSFDRARAHFTADAIALGHTRDDQAETFLLRLVRGAGPRGLAAMYARNGHIVRPLLDCRRADLRAWLGERGVAFVDDETNADVQIPRNRVRAELIPLLASRFNPSIVDVLASEADLARDAWQAIEGAANEVEGSIVKRTRNGCVIDMTGLIAIPPALRRAVVWRAMSRTSGGRQVGAEHVAAAMRMFDPDGPSSLDAPGQRLERIGASVVLTGRPPGARGRAHRADPTSPAAESDSLAGEANLFWYPLSIPGRVQLTEAGCVVSAEPDARPDRLADAGVRTGRGDVAIVRGDMCRGSLAVRNRRPGDRFHPPGLAGRKKLQDFFVDRKVRRDMRDRVPLVVDAADRIIWVAGYGIDEAFQVTDRRQAVLTLEVSQVGRGADGV